MKKMKWTCPICEKKYDGIPSTARFDNKTKICSNCGRDESVMVDVWGIYTRGSLGLKVLLGYGPPKDYGKEKKSKSRKK